MDFFDHLLGAEGCNVDGTVGSNPFTSMIDAAFSNQHDGGYLMNSMGGIGDGFQEQAIIIGNGPMSGINFPMQQPMTATHSSHYLHLGQQPFHPFQPTTNMFPPMAFPFSLPFAPSLPLASFHPQMIDGYHHSDTFNVSQNNIDNTILDSALDQQDYHDSSHLNIDEDRPEVLDQWQDYPSRQGYNQAWDDLSERLQSGSLGTTSASSRTYDFAVDNPYLQSPGYIHAAEDASDYLQEMLTKARELYQRGNVREAVLCLQSIVQLDDGSNSDEAWSLLGRQTHN